jgi:hypothetical protein
MEQTMDTLEIILRIRSCDLNSLLNGKAAHKWQHANQETKARVWERLKSYVRSNSEKHLRLGMDEVRGFIDLECDDIFYKGLPTYIVQVFTTDGLNRVDLRQKFSGPGAYQQALWYAHYRSTDSARVTITTQIEQEFKG